MLLEKMSSSGNKSLWDAAQQGEVDLVAALLDDGSAEIDYVHVEAWRKTTPLLEAIYNMQEAAALLLIERGAKVDFCDNMQRTPLHGACQHGLEKVAKELVTRGANIEAEDDRQWRPLHLASFHGYEGIARFLVERGAQVNVANSDKSTPLLSSLSQGCEPIALFLAASGAIWDAVDSAKKTALHCACRGGLTGIVTRLLDEPEFGFDLHARTTATFSGLHLAAMGGHVETCKLLLDRGVPVDELDGTDHTALQRACEVGRTDVATLLLDRDADINRSSSTDGLRSVHFALRSRVESTVLAVLDRGAKLDGPLPRGFRFASLDEAVARALEDGFLRKVFAEPETPIPPCRRALRWALASPTVAALVQKNGWSLVGAARTNEEAAAMRKNKMSLFNADGWEKRKHLTIDRALVWAYGYSDAETEDDEDPELESEGDPKDEEAACGAGEGKAAT